MLETTRTTVAALGKIFDGPHATPTRRSEGPYFLNIASLKSGRLDLSESDHVSDNDFKRWTKRIVPRAGDLLFSYETRLGEAALMPDGVKACLGRRMALLRPDPSVVESRFLLYLYLSPAFQNTISRHTIHGATVPRLGLATMPNWPVEIPALEEQRAISEVLGALDDKITANDRIVTAVLELADALFQAGLKRSFQTTVTIGELVEQGALAVGDGYRTKRAEHGYPGLRILRAGDIKDGHIMPAGEDFISEDYIRQIGQKASQPNDVIMTTKGSVGRTAVVSPSLEQVAYSPQVCYFRVLKGDSINVGHLAAWLRSANLKGQASTLMFKSDMAPYINLQDIRSLSVPIPKREELKVQGEIQGTFLASLDKILFENGQLARTRDELLPLLMRGKARVRDAANIVEEVV